MDQEFGQICIRICQFKASINMKLSTVHENRIQRLRIGLRGARTEIDEHN